MGRLYCLGVSEICDSAGDFDRFEIATRAEAERLIGAIEDASCFVTELSSEGYVAARKRRVVYVTTFISVVLTTYCSVDGFLCFFLLWKMRRYSFEKLRSWYARHRECEIDTVDEWARQTLLIVCDLRHAAAAFFGFISVESARARIHGCY